MFIERLRNEVAGEHKSDPMHCWEMEDLPRPPKAPAPPLPTKLFVCSYFWERN